MKAKLKQLVHAANRKTTAAIVAVSAFAATNAHAGVVADAIKAETTGLKEDLIAVGGVVVGLVVIRVIFGAGLRLFNRAG